MLFLLILLPFAFWGFVLDSIVDSLFVRQNFWTEPRLCLFILHL